MLGLGCSPILCTTPGPRLAKRGVRLCARSGLRPPKPAGKQQRIKIKNQPSPLRASAGEGGEGGIRTLDTSLSSYNGLANRPFRPLRHLSGSSFQKEISLLFRLAKIKINCKPASFYPIPARKTRLPKQYFGIKNSF